jgi:hypothetical protein
MADCFLARVCEPRDRMTVVRLGLPGHVETIARSGPVPFPAEIRAAVHRAGDAQWLGGTERGPDAPSGVASGIGSSTGASF